MASWPSLKTMFSICVFILNHIFTGPKEEKFAMYAWGRIAEGGRVAELGSLSSGEKMAKKIFVKRVFTIFASNASFLREFAKLQNQLSEICNIYHVIVHFLPKNTVFDPKRHCFSNLQKFWDLGRPPPHVGKNSQIISFFLWERTLEISISWEQDQH